MGNFFDAISSALGEAMRQQNVPPQGAEPKMRQPEQVQTGRPDAASETASPSFIEILESSGLGNLSGLLKQLSSGGLDEHVRSWLGTGENLPVTGAQLHNALGEEHVQNIGQQTGIPTERILQILAQFLPATVDQASPNGKLQDPGQRTH